MRWWGWWREAEEPPSTYVERWARPLSFSVDVPTEWRSAASAGLSPRVSREEALTVPAVKRARDLIAGTLGTLQPRQLGIGREPIPSPLLEQPERDVPRSVTMARTVEDMLFEERAWWRVTEFGEDGFPEHVVRLLPRSVTVREQGRVFVSTSTGQAQGVAWEHVPDAELIRFDSPNPGLLTVGARAIRACLALERTAARYADDPMPLGYFAPRDGLEPEDVEDIEEMLDDWEDARQRRVWGYVGGALEAKALTWNPEQLQLSAARDTAILEIARLAGVDPEELAVSTTSRTYANAEQRRLDLIDFTLLAYITAIEDRMSMPDVTWPGRRVWIAPDGFLRSDTLTRMQVYKLGREVGVYNDERIADIERIPSARPSAPAAAPQPPAPAVDATAPPAGIIFSSDVQPVVIGFAPPAGAAAQFAADPARRTLSGVVVPWNVAASSGGYTWMFAPGSLHWSATSRVKLDRDHRYGSEVGRADDLANGPLGLSGVFKVARGAAGDEILGLAEDGVYDGFSVEVTFSAEADGWTAHPDNAAIRLVHSATLRKVATTAMPAFDDARVTSVMARRDTSTGRDTTMSTPAQGSTATPPASAPPAAFDAAAFTAGLTSALTESFRGLIEGLPAPQRQTVRAGGGAQVTREEPVYLMNGHGNSLIRDAWKSRTEGDHEATERLRKFSRQTEDASRDAMHGDLTRFAVTTGNASQVIAPGYRPELYVTQLMQGRPLTTSVSRGTLADATPFNIPVFRSSSGAAGQHVEGVNPTPGSLVLGVETVAPTAISGSYELTREIVDSSNPAIDAIAMAAMNEDYSQQTEALVYAALRATQSGTVTSGFSPAGAQVREVSAAGGAATPAGAGDELLAAIRLSMADYPFRRFGRATHGHLSQQGTQAFAGAVDTTGRPLLPYVGPQNAVGSMQSDGGYLVDWLAFQPTWSMLGNTSDDPDGLFFNENDVWAWESALLMFRFEERSGPAKIDLALFGYFATKVLRPVGVSSVRLTVT